MATLGTLESVDLREAWRLEASDFTPWLARNLNLLGDLLKLELEHVDTEVQVFSLRADLIARDVGTDEVVLIENQLEDANLRHLGQLLAYMAGTDAKIIIWVAKDFAEHHRSAIRWLNDHTDDSYSFFAIRVRVVQIGDSALAPTFDLLEGPNEWDRTVRSETRRGLGKFAQFHHDFWKHLDSRHPGVVRRNHAGGHYDYYVEEADLCVVLYVAQKEVGVSLRGRRGVDASPRLAPYRAPLVEAVADEEPEGSRCWTGLSLDMASRDEAAWDQAADWLHERWKTYVNVLRETKVQ